MATFPTYVKLGWQDTSEAAQPIVERTEMERGVPKQRRTQSDVLVQMPVTLYFLTAADATSFETWFYTDINAGADWFSFTSLRTGGTLQVRIVGGDMGKLVPAQRTWARSQRTLTLEYLKSVV
jgi:hypothetical protein